MYPGAVSNRLGCVVIVLHFPDPPLKNEQWFKNQSHSIRGLKQWPRRRTLRNLHGQTTPADSGREQHGSRDNSDRKTEKLLLASIERQPSSFVHLHELHGPPKHQIFTNFPTSVYLRYGAALSYQQACFRISSGCGFLDSGLLDRPAVAQ